MRNIFIEEKEDISLLQDSAFLIMDVNKPRLDDHLFGILVGGGNYIWGLLLPLPVAKFCDGKLLRVDMEGYL